MGRIVLATSPTTDEEYGGTFEEIKTSGSISKYSQISGGTLDRNSLVKVGNTVFASARLYNIVNLQLDITLKYLENIDQKQNNM